MSKEVSTEIMEEKGMSTLFHEGLKTFEEICKCEMPTNCSEVQYKVKKCMNLLEDVTRMASAANLFSSNETVAEVATTDLKFMLLPAMLGTLSLKLTGGDRKQIVLTSEAYFKDFLKRCVDYSIVTASEVPSMDKEDDGKQTTGTSNAMPDLLSMARKRAYKIQQFHREKEMELELEQLRNKYLSDSADEETQRKYFLSMIKSLIAKSTDELDCLQAEKNILKQKEEMAKEEEFGETSQSSLQSHAKKNPKTKPLLPVIITKDEIQKKVFGAGYPSLPTMTVEELCSMRLRDGTWDSGQGGGAMDMAKNEELKKEQTERDVIEREQLLEKDDQETLLRDRNMDEYKDTHSRGWGNRYNRS